MIIMTVNNILQYFEPTFLAYKSKKHVILPNNRYNKHPQVLRKARVGEWLGTWGCQKYDENQGWCGGQQWRKDYVYQLHTFNF